MNKHDLQEPETLTEKVGDPNIEPGVNASATNIASEQQKDYKKYIPYILGILILMLLISLFFYLQSLFQQKENYQDVSISFEGQTEDTTIARQQEALMNKPRFNESYYQDQDSGKTDNNTFETVTIEPPITPPAPKTKQFGMVDWDSNSSNTNVNANSTINDEFSTPQTPIPTVANSMNTSMFTSSVAKIDRVSPTYRVGKGTSILCTLNTKIDTSRPGMVTCMVSKPVYSDDGKMILIDKGSIVVGEQNSGLMNTNRAFITWYEVRTPFNITINIQSPASDSLGAAGVTGKINQQMFKKFLAGTMISVIHSAEDYLKIKNSKNNELNLSQDMDIQNYLKDEFIQERTLVVNPGTLVNIQLIRDLDFSKVYKRF